MGVRVPPPQVNLAATDDPAEETAPLEGELTSILGSLGLPAAVPPPAPLCGPVAGTAAGVEVAPVGRALFPAFVWPDPLPPRLASASTPAATTRMTITASAGPSF